jgi:hypothetical protein
MLVPHVTCKGCRSVCRIIQYLQSQVTHFIVIFSCIKEERLLMCITFMSSVLKDIAEVTLSQVYG